MTPLEKASQMIVDYQLTFKSLSYEEAVQCSIRTVDDILQELELVCVDEMVQFSNRWKYWEEVKELLQKQSNKHHIVDTNEMVDQVPDVRKMVEWIDKEILLNPYYADSPRLREGANMVKVKLQQYTPTSSQTEISDEEIEKFTNEFAEKYSKVGITENEVSAFFTGMKWYREQLKKK